MMDFSLSRRWALISLVAVIARVASAADSGANGTWLYPDPQGSPTFNYLDTLNASWTSDFSAPWLHLWCGVLNPNSSSPNLGEPYNKTAPATGSRLFPLSQIFPPAYALEPFSCHFELSRKAAVGQGPPFAMGGTFYVRIDENAQPVTWSQDNKNSSAASTGTNASSGPQSTASPASTTSSNSTAAVQSSGSNSGLSQGAKIGIGVGVTLGVLALFAAAAALFWLRRRNARRAPTDTYGPYGTQLPAEKSGSSKMMRSEMPVDSQIHEKDSAPVATHTIGELEAPRY